MVIAIGCDEAAFMMKELVKALLEKKNYTVIDKGVYNMNPVSYPDIAVSVAEEVVLGNAERGILICGTGIGMAIAANKVPGIRAAVCHDPYSTERSRKSNNAQIMCMGARVIGIELANYLVELWLTCEFSGGGSTEKVQRIADYERKFMKREA